MIPRSTTLMDGTFTLKPLGVVDADDLVKAVQESVDELIP